MNWNSNDINAKVLSYVIIYCVDIELSTINLHGSGDKRKFQVSKFCRFWIVSQRKLNQRKKKNTQSYYKCSAVQQYTWLPLNRVGKCWHFFEVLDFVSTMFEQMAQLECNVKVSYGAANV